MIRDQTYIEGILLDLVDLNPLACRALLKICKVTLTREVPTAAITLTDPPELAINPDFLEEHCPNDSDVTVVLMHEFMHVLLHHHLLKPPMSLRMNLACDLLINPMLCMAMGSVAVHFLAHMYGDCKGLGRLLAPPNPKIRGIDRFDGMRECSHSPEERHLETLHITVWRSNGAPTLEDILDLLPGGGGTGDGAGDGTGDGEGTGDTDGWEALPLLLGNHSGYGAVKAAAAAAAASETAPPVLSEAMKNLLNDSWQEMLRVVSSWGPHFTMDAYHREIVDARWRAQLNPILRRIMQPENGRQGEGPGMATVFQPWRSARDRRATLDLGHQGILPFRPHTIPRPAGGAVQVYLDVSGSMRGYLPGLLRMLQTYLPMIRKPFWAFSTEVVPARLQKGKLTTNSTGGTSITAVFDHMVTTQARRVLVITDGYVERGICIPKGTVVEALIPHNGYADILQSAGVRVSRLPPMPT